MTPRYGCSGFIRAAFAVGLLTGYGCTGEMSAPSKSELIGSWTVETIGERPVIDRSPAFIEFTPEDTVGGNASCNRFSGGYILSGSRLSFTQAAATRMMCPDALMEQEGRFLASLEQVSQVNIENGLLILQDEGGTRLIGASRREDGE